MRFALDDSADEGSAHALYPSNLRAFIDEVERA